MAGMGEISRMTKYRKKTKKKELVIMIRNNATIKPPKPPDGFIRCSKCGRIFTVFNPNSSESNNICIKCRGIFPVIIHKEGRDYKWLKR